MAKKKNKKKKNLLHKTERDILILLNKSIAAFSINQIADKLEISYMTARKYTYSLLEKKLIQKIEEHGKPKKTKRKN